MTGMPARQRPAERQLDTAESLTGIAGRPMLHCGIRFLHGDPALYAIVKCPGDIHFQRSRRDALLPPNNTARIQ